MSFEHGKENIEIIRNHIQDGNGSALGALLNEVHHADIAEIFDDLNFEEAKFLLQSIDEVLAADTLMEVDEDLRDRMLKSSTDQEIANQINSLDSDDAADLIGDLSDQRQADIISNMEDIEHASEIVDLLNYDEDSAGGLMQKEYIKANVTWPVNRTVVELRKQAEDVERVFTIYVVDQNEHLLGVLSLKRLLFAQPNTKIEDLYMSKNIISVKTSDDKESVAQIMQKYDLVTVPVVDLVGKLVGRITIDDVVDVIREEAEKDYQMASGLSENVDADSSIWKTMRARLPWLILGLLGGLGSVFIMEGFEEALTKYKQLFFFTPLIAAMAGNVGVQSSGIIVQGLANKSIQSGGLWKRLGKEIGTSFLNGIALAILVILFGIALDYDMNFYLTIASSLIIVILIAAVIGTSIPLILNKWGIDPALATGPFITTSNDIFGIFIFFYLAKVILGF
jgi:magnesium transporter